jgi:hypothetical protein
MARRGYTDGDAETRGEEPHFPDPLLILMSEWVPCKRASFLLLLCIDLFDFWSDM